MTEPTNKEIITQVAKQLGGVFGCRAEYERDCYGTVTLSDGVVFWAHVDGYGNQNRIRFSSNYPQHKDSRGALTSTLQRDFDRSIGYDKAPFSGITCAKDRPAEAIARDVENRFLKVYRPLYAQALEYCATQVAYYDKLEANKQATTDAFAGLTGYNQDRSWRIEVRHVGSDSTGVALNSLTPDQVKKLAKFLRGL